jgi:hypothetical protein
MTKIISKTNLSIYILFILTCIFFISCEKDDFFSGSPVDSGVNFINVKGSVATNELQLVPGQSFPITISLGDDLTTSEVDLLKFPVDVNVEVTAFIKGQDRRTKLTFTIPAGENSIEATMVTPSLGVGGQTSVSYFDLELQMYLTSLVTSADVTPSGFAGKQYKMVSDTLERPFGTTNFGESANPLRCHIRFDWDGPWGNTNNNLDIVFKKNGIPFKISNDAGRPVYGTTIATTRYESINFYDKSQEYEIMNLSISDSISGIYTIKSPNQTTNNKPHGFKVGDEIKIESINGSSSIPLTSVVTSVLDDYTCVINTLGPHLFEGIGPSFYQPKIVPRVNTTGVPEIWSPFVAYNANQSIKINSITYYCKRDISANPNGNLPPAIDVTNWTNVKPYIDWSFTFNNSISWSSGRTYLVNEVVNLNNVNYVCIKQHTSSASNSPSTNTVLWSTAMVKYKNDVLHYTASDTYTIETFAKKLVSSPLNLKYRFAVLLPSGIGKVYSGFFNGLNAPQTSANAILKLTIQRSISQGVSTYNIVHAE